MHATFTGSSRRPRNVNLSGQNVNPFAAAWSPSGASSVHKTLSQAQAERQQRQLGRDRLRAAKNIQRTWRGYSTRKSFKLSQSAALQALYETPTGTREDRLQAALPLLFVTFRPDHESDQRVLSAFLADLSESNLCLVHDMPNPRLIRFLKLVLSSFGSRYAASRLVCQARETETVLT